MLEYVALWQIHDPEACVRSVVAIVAEDCREVKEWQSVASMHMAQICLVNLKVVAL